MPGLLATSDSVTSTGVRAGPTPAGPLLANGGSGTPIRITRAEARLSSTTPTAGSGPDSHHIQASPAPCGIVKLNWPSTAKWVEVHATEPDCCQPDAGHCTALVLGVSR